MSMTGGIDKEVHICNGMTLRHEKDKVMPFAVTWTDLEIVVLSEVSQTHQTQKDIICYHSHVESKKRYK